MAKKEAVKEVKFTKEQILKSNNYVGIEKDIIDALLEDKCYTLEEVKKILEDFNNKEVK
ncbi:hypothetical protein JOC70_000343 [Clostridium pascui]|uniref:hypothetical protein n=1 Tax=Clostridium pascui TaxID=46609 RepID=UPI00195D508A|nr:hypothetical protein [Clostridium pascui]MBM7868874.1 hypothetical protein [Clostridium pascui]